MCLEHVCSSHDRMHPHYHAVWTITDAAPQLSTDKRPHSQGKQVVVSNFPKFPQLPQIFLDFQLAESLPHIFLSSWESGVSNGVT